MMDIYLLKEPIISNDKESLSNLKKSIICEKRR
jgi:hypothetical protein